jgi:hypothetical protein
MPVPNFLGIGRQVASQVLAELSPTAKAYLDAAPPGQMIPGVSTMRIPPFGPQQQQQPGQQQSVLPPGAIPPFGPGAGAAVA